MSLILMLSLVVGVSFAKDEEGKGKTVPKTMGKSSALLDIKSSALLDINMIECYVTNDGSFGEHPTTGGDGFYFPKGQRTLSIIYTAGIWFVGKQNGEIKSAVNCYGAEFQPGVILSPGVPDDPLDPKYKMYKYNAGDAIDADAIAQGCPDEILGDQMLFAVYNDICDHSPIWGKPPMGLEVQHTVFGFNRSGALGHTVFQRMRVINKSDTDMLESYVGIFYDPDLGFANDDYTGCDSNLGLAIIYNGDGYDEKYGVGVPAMGSDFFQGPIVPSPGEDATLPDGTVIPDSKIMGMTAYFAYINGSPIEGMTDPHTPEGGYYFCSGFVGNGDEWIDPTAGNAPTKFPFAGDPVKGTGWLMSDITAPDDMRMGNATGPFDLLIGEQQDIVAGCVVGLGTDNLSSITVMKFYDAAAQIAYDKNFILPAPPAQPVITVAEMDGSLMLNWDEEASYHDDDGYLFQGYNIYQGEGVAGPWTKIATYDIIDGITTIWDLEYAPSIGALVEQPVQFGADTGVTFKFDVEKDYIRKIPLVNGRPYYFAVTAYAYNSVGVPKVLENAQNGVPATPQKPVLDVEYHAEGGEVLDVTHTGNSTGYVTATIVDPTAVMGHDYEVQFEVVDDAADPHDGETFWKLVNMTTGEVKHTSFNQTVTTGNMIVDGMEIYVKGDAGGYYDWDVPSGARKFTWAGGAAGWGLPGFSGALTWESPATWWGSGYQYPILSLKTTLLKLANVQPDGTFDPNDENVSYGYRYLRSASSPPAKPEFAPFIINPSGGTYPFQDYTKSVPLSAWDVSDPASPRRLMLGHQENNQPNGLVDGKYWPPYYNEGDNTASDGPREHLFIFDEDYSETPNPAYQVPISEVDAPIMWWATWARRNTTEWSAEGTGYDQFRIICMVPNTPADVFAFSSEGYEKVKGDDIAKKRLDDINAFPNPYFGHNSAEATFYSQFVTFNNLPEECTIRIFSLSGQLVNTLEHNDGTPFQRWYLQNHEEIPVASGMYIVHIDTEFGDKIIKLAVINRQAQYQHI